MEGDYRPPCSERRQDDRMAGWQDGGRDTLGERARERWTWDVAWKRALEREEGRARNEGAPGGMSCAAWCSVCATPSLIINHALRRTLGSAIVEGVYYGASAHLSR